MANYLQVKKREQVRALLELGWSYRRIERETGVHRETAARYDRLRNSNPAKVFAGSEAGEQAEKTAFEGEATRNPAKVFAGSEANPAKVFAGSEANPAKVFAGSRPRSLAAPYHDAIAEGIGQGLTAQRIWQDLVEDYGFAHSYECVKRYVRALEPTRRVVGVMHSAPGEEAQVDFFRGAPTLHPQTGRWRRPWVFRMTLCHSRHGYEEAVWDQKLRTFLRLHERAFSDLGGVPKVIRHDNLKAAVVRACLYDPDSNEVYTAFAKHWGFTPLPTRPRNPRENGKQERSGGYVKDNALKGRRFDSLQEHNDYLRRWNRSIARLRIHGTTRRQVWAHFLATDKEALQPSPPERFALFDVGTRSVHPDGHVEVAGAFYRVAGVLLGQRVQVRWDDRLVRVYHRGEQVAVHARVAPGQYAAAVGDQPCTIGGTQQAFLTRLLGRCQRVGPELHEWAERAFERRGVRALRLIQGVLGLTRQHPRERVLWAARRALDNELFRYRDLKRLAAQKAATVPHTPLLFEHPTIRPMADYRLEDLT